MIKSMTGYGTAKGVSGAGGEAKSGGSTGAIDITIEVRSVNNRYLDCNIRLPRVYTSMEDTLKSTVTRSISRGESRHLCEHRFLRGRPHDHPAE